MSRVLAGIFNWFVRQTATLLLILAVLLGWAWFGGELKKVEELRAERAGLLAKRDAIIEKREALKRNATERSRIADSNIRNHASIGEKAQADRKRLSEEHPWARRIPLSDVWLKIKFLEKEIEFSRAAIDEAGRLKVATEKALNAFATQAEGELKLANQQIAAIEEKLVQDSGMRMANALHQQLPVALGVLLSIILVPIATKVFLYFVVAPRAAGRTAIRLLPAASGRIRSLPGLGVAENGLGRISAVSIPIVLGENQELLIQPEYFQSTSLESRKSTRWLLDTSIPVSSLLSGMFMLTRVESAGSEPIVVSATREPLSEVGIIDLADGAAFVCQPRSLAGVIQDGRNPIRITRHWRLGSLQGWLTLQLRFLVFHGPGQLVMKGCRGIRIEPANKGRLINQAATLGFSANLDYSNVRCETFVAYWTGKEDLFNDLFKGESGAYVYEETPNARRAGGIGGRPLEGFTDAVLKIFGV